MGDAEFDMVLERVVAVIGSDALSLPPATVDGTADGFIPPAAANDNDLTWPFIPFPDGWTATN